MQSSDSVQHGVTPPFSQVHSCLLLTRFRHSHLYLFPPPAFLLLFPNLGLAPPLPPDFIRLTLKPDRSPELTASPDLACLFLPPKPYLASFFCRLAWGAPEGAPGLFLPAETVRLSWALISLSTATSKRSSASVAPRAEAEPSARSVKQMG